MVKASAFGEVEFWLLLLFSFVVPVGIYWGLLVKRSVARLTVLAFGLALVALAGIDVYFLQILGNYARGSASGLDNLVFASEVSLALYLIPLTFGGIGVNMISHTLIQHLTLAERRRDQEREGDT